MTEQTLVIIEIAISAVVGGGSGFAVAMVKMVRYAEKVDQLEKANLNQRLSVLEGRFDERKDIGAFVTRQSPLTMNKKGEELLKDSGAKDFVDKIKADLIAKIRKKKPKSAYDVQELSVDIIKNYADKDEFIPIKDYVFKEGMDMEPIFTVSGIYLRDIALPELGFEYEDIDKTSPQSVEQENQA